MPQPAAPLAPSLLKYTKVFVPDTQDPKIPPAHLEPFPVVVIIPLAYEFVIVDVPTRPTNPPE